MITAKMERTRIHGAFFFFLIKRRNAAGRHAPCNVHMRGVFLQKKEVLTCEFRASAVDM